MTVTTANELGKADLSGKVQSLAGPVFRDGQQKPRFSFAILSGGKQIVLDVDLDRPGASTIVPVVCAAFQAGVLIEVGLLQNLKDRVDWVQVPKPPAS